jgi:hypothetical protein
MVIYNIPKQGYQIMTPSERLPPLWRKSMEGKTQGKSARRLVIARFVGKVKKLESRA